MYDDAPEGIRSGPVCHTAHVDDDGCFSIQVKDTGIGIAPGDIDKVMMPFTQADSTLSRKYEGTGLGLPLTKALIEMHGGTFTLHSELGVGTEATALFPAHRTVGNVDNNDLIGVA